MAERSEKDAAAGRARASASTPALDAIVVGGGVIGLACAWRAAGRGLDVCVIERAEPGAGASSVAAGMLTPVGEALWGEEALVRFELAAAALYPEFATELEAASGCSVPYRRCGALHVAIDRDEAGELRRRFELHRSLGLATEWLSGAECRRLEPGLSAQAGPGIHAPEEAEIDPRALVAALVAACERAGVRIRSGAAAAELLLDAGVVRGVRTTDGEEMVAPRVVAATGCWAGEGEWLPAAVRPPVRPVKGEVLRLRSPLGEAPCERIVGGARVYIVPREDGELVVGATVEERGFDTTVTAGGAHELLREAYRTVPEIAELELVEAIAGLRPGTPDNSPIIGPCAIGGLVMATGHYRNGIILAPTTAEAIAALLAGESPPEEVAAFGPQRFAAERAPGDGTR